MKLNEITRKNEWIVYCRFASRYRDCFSSVVYSYSDDRYEKFISISINYLDT